MFRDASTSVPSLGGQTCFCIGSGALPGDKIAADIFKDVCHKSIQTWVNDDCTNMGMVACPICRAKCTVGKSIYADDLCAKQVFDRPPRTTAECPA